MEKREFMIYLRHKLRRFGDNSAEDAVAYYDEIISEKMRDGMSEKEAVASLGNPATIVADTASDMVANNKVKNPARGIGLVVGTLLLSPVLFPIAIVILTLYFVIFVVYASLVLAFGASAVGLIAGGFASLFISGNPGASLVILGLSLIAAAIMGLLCIAIAKFGKDFINLITVKLVRKIRKTNLNKKTRTI